MSEDGRALDRDLAVIAGLEQQFSLSEPRHVQAFPRKFQEIVENFSARDDVQDDQSVAPGSWSKSFEWHSRNLQPSTRVRGDLQRQLDRQARLRKQKSTRSALLDRWAARAETDKAGVARMNLEFVLSRLLRIYTLRQAEIWMESHNQQLAAKPVDVILMRSVADAIAALELLEQQAY